MRPLLLPIGLLAVLSACSPDQKSNVNQATSDLKGAGADAAVAAGKLAAAAEHDADADAANAASASGNALENAGADLKRDAKRGPNDPS